jgi:glycine/D-amino acid oxidase-like deaminating enzyme
MRIGKKKSKSRSKDPIVIVGMGIAGLTTAIELVKKGCNVTILEKREHFARTQKVNLDSNSKKFITSLLYKSKSPKVSKQLIASLVRIWLPKLTTC